MTADQGVTGPHVRLFAAARGSSGEMIVLLHGVGGRASLWDAISERLSAQYRTVAYDLPGHAGSLHYPGAGPVKVAVGAVLDDLKRRGVGRAHLVGHSMGGAIATLMTISQPDLVASLTLVAPGGMGEEINRPVLQRFALAASPGDLADVLADMAAPGTSAAASAIAPQADARAQPGQTDMLTAIVDRISRDGKQGVISRELLAKLEMPVRVVWGTEDPILPFTQTQNLPDHFSVQPVPGAGHMLIEEASDAVVTAIEANLAAAKRR